MVWRGLRELALGIVRRASVGLMALSVACARPGRTPTSYTPPNELAVLLYEYSHPCGYPQPGSTSGDSEQASETFVEAVVLDVPLHATSTAPIQIDKLATWPDVRVLGTPHISGKFDVPTTVSLEQHFGVLDQAELARVLLVPRHAAEDHQALEFEFFFALPNADPAQNPRLASTPLLVEGADNQAQVGSAEHPSDPQRRLVVVAKAYPIRGPEDLRGIFECKMRLHGEALERARAD